MGSNGDWKPLYISLILLFVIGGIIPLCISIFTNVEVTDYTGYLDFLVNFMEDGFVNFLSFDFLGLFQFDGFTFNPFDLFGSEFKNFIVTQTIAFSYIPSIIGIPLILLIIVGILWGLRKLLPF